MKTPLILLLLGLVTASLLAGCSSNSAPPPGQGFTAQDKADLEKKLKANPPDAGAVAPAPK